MGFRIPTKTALLVFDGDYEGAEVRVRLNVPVRIYLDVLTGGDDDVPGSRTRSLIETALSLIVDWNLEDKDSKPVPLTMEGMLSDAVDMPFLNLVVSQWADASNPSAPLGKPSANGVQASDQSPARSRGRK